MNVFLQQGQEKQHLFTPLQQRLSRILSPKTVHPGNLKVARVTVH